VAAAADGSLTLWGWPREDIAKGSTRDAAAAPTLLRKWRLGSPIDHVVLLNDVHPTPPSHLPPSFASSTHGHLSAAKRKLVHVSRSESV
jgi:hypothetical protein